MILKARQQGASTGCLIEQFDYAITNQNITACILAHEQDSIKKLFRIPRRAYDYLPAKQKPILDRGGGSKHELYFPLLNSRIYCDLESRGDTIHWLHVSEMAFIQEPERLLATLQAVPLDGYVTLESTANGMGNLFYEMWQDQEQPYEKLFFPWFIFPEYQISTESLVITEDEEALLRKAAKNFNLNLSHAQIAYRRYKQKELGSLFLQEYPEDDSTCFLSSGSSAMNLFLIKESMAKRLKPIEETKTLSIYKTYDKTRRYVCGVDCAEGVGGDFSVATIFDARSLEQVAVLRGQLKPYDFAGEINSLCRRYVTGGRGYPLLAVERNNHGHAVLLELKEHLKYPNLFHRVTNTVTKEKDQNPGWVTDKVTRPIMMDAFIDAVENRTAILNDQETFKECLTLINNDGKIQAAEGKHDDCIVASAIAVQMCIESAVYDIYDNIKDRILVG
jgi:hypothetical protein